MGRTEGQTERRTTPTNIPPPEDGKTSLKFKRPKGINSVLTNYTPIKLHVHTLIMAIYIQYKFHEILSVGYLVMAEVRKWDGRKDRQKDGQRQPISLRLWGEITNKKN